jgi:dihydrofolate reductase
LTKPKVIAGGKKVVAASTTIVQQCLNAGLLDEIHIHLIPSCLVTVLACLSTSRQYPVKRESLHVEEGLGVTHLAYSLKK